jgi:hypothetical protein
MTIEQFVAKYSALNRRRIEMTVAEKAAVDIALRHNLAPDDQIYSWLSKGQVAQRVGAIIPNKIEQSLENKFQVKAWRYYHLNEGMDKAVQEFDNDPKVIWQYFMDYLGSLANKGLEGAFVTAEEYEEFITNIPPKEKNSIIKIAIIVALVLMCKKMFK